jgi:phosphoglycolate phosphatase-like HAD superfamily hydrolase
MFARQIGAVGAAAAMFMTLRYRALAARRVTNLAGHVTAASAAPALVLSNNTIWALDFDGVVTDSARETGTSAWKCCEALWPDWQPRLAFDQVIASFCAARPALETGWESTLMVRLLASGSVDAGMLLSDFQPKLKHAEMEALGLSKEQLVQAFNDARTAWIATDEGGWLASHDFYPEVVAAAQHLVERGEDVYIVTTKSAAFTKRLLDKVEIPVPDHKIFGLGSGKKWSTLLKLLEQAGRPADTRVFFLEDRLDALEEVRAREEAVSSKTDLALALWGYNMPDARRVAQEKGMALLEPADFLLLATSHTARQ